MKILTRTELKTWAAYFIVLLLAIYVHEIGHCIPAWINGYKVIPTPAKEYAIDAIPGELQQYISLGGIAASVLLGLTILFLYLRKNSRISSVVLAASIANPGLYSVMFLFRGRGHNDTEFQEAQAALGMDYSGHSVDWIFVSIFIAGALAWIIKSKPGYKNTWRLLFGAVLTFLFVVALQEINNAIFDPIFQNR